MDTFCPPGVPNGTFQCSSYSGGGPPPPPQCESGFDVWHQDCLNGTVFKTLTGTRLFFLFFPPARFAPCLFFSAVLRYFFLSFFFCASVSRLPPSDFVLIWRFWRPFLRPCRPQPCDRRGQLLCGVLIAEELRWLEHVRTQQLRHSFGPLLTDFSVLCHPTRRVLQ